MQTKGPIHDHLFIRNGGNDSNSGLDDANAWALISKVNGFGFAAGDIAQFKRGSTFSGTTLNVKKQVTYQDYRTGALPVIDGPNGTNRPTSP